MQLILIMQITLRLVKENWFLKIMHHLSIILNGVKIDNTEYLDVAMPMYNLLEYS